MTKIRIHEFQQNGTKIVLCDFKTMEKAFPNQEIRSTLIDGLRRRKNVALILYSDLDSKTIDDHCWGYEIGIISEQGCSYRAPWSNIWNHLAEMDDHSWESQTEEVLKLFIGRVPGSVLIKNSVIS